MVWGCVSAAGICNLCLLKENMDRYMYLDILKKNFLISAERFSLGYFQQDNNPQHTSKSFQEWCIYHVKQQPTTKIPLSVLQVPGVLGSLLQLDK
ncbi:hypothetical protein AVEN_161237-1 [Araneus ventricosus]|uniref:Transposable element Tcb2 transposase n=1 Tax=Araneus ventricosus TaxID=182803 RepID=A0A4Y2QAR9_ARAVE|nr:hypothetical protein AVEN_161237-1 [Araneus ventricosus]